ncbi:uncharacterized protein BKA55DRAFT_685048 [Fusarium redolens]|uniref:Uncharacterized protein n=1 Tax=Fusarium redolens TaxID=48865 RepID=A0A9P9KSG9_FUSRE|nr:uncharacterized protein BKA55DRAFT_685048 [Fusarium redolens]KAH7267765.1 hypothetical protein BKA55DRAFT_685048 [Fusarium redolens]
MAQNNTRPEPPVVERDGFSLTKGSFCASNGNVEQVSGSRLHELFWPESLRLKRDQKKASEEARELFKKAFFAGQLKHYGISFHPRNSKVGELKELLINAVAQGHCDHVPQSVLSLRQSMEQVLQPLYEKWEKDVHEWDTNDRRRRLEELNNCKTLGEKASYNLDLFLEHYFTTNGQPDQHKTPEPLSLEGFDDKLPLHLKAGEIPGLYTKSGGSKDKRTLCIAEKREREMKWAKAMEAHEQFTSTIKPPPPSLGRKASRASTLKNVKGRISSSAILLRANYDFRIITGAMLLYNDEETLDDPVGDSDDDSGTDDSAESEDKRRHEERRQEKLEERHGKKNQIPSCKEEKDSVFAVPTGFLSVAWRRNWRRRDSFRHRGWGDRFPERRLYQVLWFGMRTPLRRE